MKDYIYGEFEEIVQPGEKVWYSGELSDDWHLGKPKEIIVGVSYHESEEWSDDDHCYEEVNSFWNEFFFRTQEEAEKKNREERIYMENARRVA